MNFYKNNIEKLAEKLPTGISGMIVATPANIRYLSYVDELTPIPTYIFVTKNSKSIAIVPILEKYRAERYVHADELYFYGNLPYIKTDGKKAIQLLKKILSKYGNKYISDEKIPSIKTKVKRFLTSMRSTKSNIELKRIIKAVKIAKTAWSKVKDKINCGMSEIEVANEINTALNNVFSGPTPFETIVATGNNTTYPHWTTTQRKITEKDVVICDFGATYKGYCSDITRCIFMDKIDKNILEIYEILKYVKNEVTKKIHIGMRFGKIDLELRDTFKKYNLHKYFIHSTGHGIGLEVHENLRIIASNREKIVSGNAFTIEPGIYIKNKFGIRIEDDIIVDKAVRQIS